MATITLKTPEGETHTFECDDDTSILDALEEAGLEHNYSCCLLYTSPSPRDS